MLPNAHPAATAPALLGEPPLELLSRFERGTFRLMDTLFTKARPLTELWLRSVGAGWMTLGSKDLVVARGLERLAGLTYDDGILLVANHRSFFDLYMLSLVLHRRTVLRQPVMCPVRADFFYQTWTGGLVNLLVGGGRMFPPFFREPQKGDFNKWALGRVADELRRGKLLVGFHPEGTRNKGPDPYSPLPAQPGVGKLVMETWPIVVPAFINGLSSNILSDIKANYTGERRAVAIFGAPVDLSEFRNKGNRLATHKRIADRLLQIIFDLSREERQVRMELGLP